MSKKTGIECVAPETSCGTASGWRRGGRCYRCREAHNLESNQYRGLNRDQRDLLLEALRAGATPDAAAESVGVSVQALSTLARYDAELWAALDGQPVEVQRAARAVAFLAALARTGGDFPRACTIAGVTPREVRAWQTNHPDYAAMESQTLNWLKQRQTRRYTPRVSDEVLDKAAEALEGGAGITAAAQVVGLTAQGLRNAAPRHPRLTAALPEKKLRTSPGVATRLTEEVERDLRELWNIRSLRRKDIAVRLGVSVATLGNWIRDLELPPRRINKAGT